MGQTEALLTIRPFLPHLTRSELMTVMTASAWRTSAVELMAAYISKGVEAKHPRRGDHDCAGNAAYRQNAGPETEVVGSGSSVEMAVEVDEAKGMATFWALDFCAAPAMV